MRRFKSLAAMSLAAATVAGCLFMPAEIVKADGEGLEINEENFEDEIFIKYARGCDLNEDGYLSDEELGMAKIFVIQNTKLKSLKGIEHFYNLESINILESSISHVDLSKNTKLKSVEITNSKLEEIDVSMLSDLENLNVYNNQITSLDLSNNTSLLFLNCRFNRIHDTLNLKNNMFLKTVDCSSNQWLTKIDFYCPFLRKLNCSCDHVSKIDFSDFLSLEELDIGDTDLVSIDLSENKNLKYLQIDGMRSEKLSRDLDLSGCTKLQTLIAGLNNFNSIIFPESLVYLSLNIHFFTNLDLSNLTNLKELYLSQGKLTSITLPKHTIEYLDLRDNQLTELDLSGQDKLISLDCYRNEIPSLDVSDCKNIHQIVANENNLKTLDISSIELSKQKLEKIEHYQYQLFAVYDKYDDIEVDYWLTFHDKYGDRPVFAEALIAVDEDVTIQTTPTPSPSATPVPTVAPSKTPTSAPTSAPSGKPTSTPTVAPTKTPTVVPTGKPTVAPTSKPGTTVEPTVAPTKPTTKPGVTNAPSATTVPGKPTATPADNATTEPTKAPSVENFAERLYTTCLGREAEEAGKDYWTSELKAGKPGAEVAEGFFFSPEYEGRKLNNKDFIGTLYETFMGRTPADEEVAYWSSEMDNGKTRKDIFDGFVNSPEWADICLTYGIRSGGLAAPTFEKEASDAVKAFAERLYTTCLGREAEKEGLEWWAAELANLRQTGTVAASGFFNSPEFIGLKTDDNEYVTRLYKTFMGRDPEEAGFEFWTSELKAGKDRQYVFDGFSVAPEFANLCAEAGIMR